MIRIIGIYKITSPSKKIYIGQSNNIYKRWNEYKRLQCLEQPKLYNSLKHYSPENHIFEILEECDELKLNELETWWKFYYGYQCVEEGLCCNYWDNNGPLSEETKRKIGIGNKGKLKLKPEGFGKKTSERLKGNKYRVNKKQSEEHRKWFSEFLKGNKRRLGTKNSEETIKKMSKAKDHTKKKIYCIELDTYYDSISDASRKLGIGIMIISNSINNKMKSNRKKLTFKLVE